MQISQKHFFSVKKNLLRIYNPQAMPKVEFQMFVHHKKLIFSAMVDLWSFPDFSLKE